MKAAIRAVEYHLPDAVLSSSDLAADFPDWSVGKIEEKTGIAERHIAGATECASDLGVGAALKLFASGACRPDDIDFLLFCTQSPDYFLPTTACLLQHRLGIPKTAGALDFNLGCSGFVFGLGLARGLVETGQARNVLLITAETYSKFINSRDRSVRTIFGDAGAATLIHAVEADEPLMGPFVYGTDGSGAGNLIVPVGGARLPRSVTTAEVVQDDAGNYRSEENLFMNGAEIFAFTIREIPRCVEKLLCEAGLDVAAVDLFVFHQANQYMLTHLRKKMGIPENKFLVSMRHCGNTVSSTIPIVLKDAMQAGRIISGARIVIVGFGVGYSWGAAMLRWA